MQNAFWCGWVGITGKQFCLRLVSANGFPASVTMGAGSVCRPRAWLWPLTPPSRTVVKGRAIKVCSTVNLSLLFSASGLEFRRPRLKCDGTRAETRFRLSAKRTSPFKSAGASIQSTAGSRGVRISGSNAGYTMLRGSVTSTGYPLHSPVPPSLPLPCVTVCHQVSTGLYKTIALLWEFLRKVFRYQNVLPAHC